MRRKAECCIYKNIYATASRYFFFLFLAVPGGLWDPSFPIWDHTWALLSESKEF